MANTTKFVGDFREAVTGFLNAASTMVDLTEFYTSMGWTVTDFVTPCAGTDLTETQFVAAVTAVIALTGTMTTAATALGKLRA